MLMSCEMWETPFFGLVGCGVFHISIGMISVYDTSVSYEAVRCYKTITRHLKLIELAGYY